MLSQWGGARTALGAHSGRRQCCVPPRNQSRVLGPPLIPQPVISSIVAHREQWTRSCSTLLTFCTARLGGLSTGGPETTATASPWLLFPSFVKKVLTVYFLISASHWRKKPRIVLIFLKPVLWFNSISALNYESERLP